MNLTTGETWLLRLVTRARNQVGLNLLHYVIGATSGSPVSDVQAVAALSTAFAPLYIALLNINAVFHGVDLRRLLPAGSSPVFTTADSNDGSAAGDLMAMQTAGLISKKTNLGGRRNRGRLYASFPAESDNTSNAQPQPSYISRLQLLANEVAQIQTITSIAPPGTAEMVPVIFHQDLGTSIQVDSCVARGEWATMKTRGAYGRPNTVPF